MKGCTWYALTQRFRCELNPSPKSGLTTLIRLLLSLHRLYMNSMYVRVCVSAFKDDGYYHLGEQRHLRMYRLYRASLVQFVLKCCRERQQDRRTCLTCNTAQISGENDALRRINRNAPFFRRNGAALYISSVLLLNKRLPGDGTELMPWYC